MGNGDRKSRKGKIRMGSFGVRRPRKKRKAVTTKPFKVKAPEIIAEVKNVKPEVAVKTKVHPKEETSLINAEVKHEIIAETTVNTEIKVETKVKAEPKAKTKEKAEPKTKAKEKAKVKAEPKAEAKPKKTKKQE